MLTLRKANERGHFNHGWLDTYHSFSFAGYYDERFMGFSALRVINEDRVEPSKGFGTHSHKDMEILTYVLSGTIAHKDSMGNEERVPSGEFQIMSVGSGITHSEFNLLDEPLHFYQIWIQPNELGITPRYEQKAFDTSKGKRLILSPNAEQDSLKVYQDMRLWLYRDIASETFSFDSSKENSRRAYIQVVRGKLEIESSQTKPFIIKTSDGVMCCVESSFTLKGLDSSNEVLIFDLP
ncbi:pirin family protein [Helicobacter cinaedi]|uniref:Pirin family protein n=1 Tax=Helicobacter cinaedi CCUG 18818 = ATCC BAA-847 TaxID=537971 RepID=A0AAI8MNS6_9HELI|nr:pirin family protein [Helicobacter cinaedi]EFR45637.1 pirin family protein [Helicobacter cinaedi CCUG 18818 = ATCC BAA-847]QOQ91065.1 pirin family protein [Helicobacter cinaedi]QOQ95261.1 pirin family protein [Helicobacter cinaedi]BAM33009.1 pirin family protein [Helicobacter cinaedi CCUG 18818 = ATCC BAA-847]